MTVAGAVGLPSCREDGVMQLDPATAISDGQFVRHGAPTSKQKVEGVAAVVFIVIISSAALQDVYKNYVQSCVFIINVLMLSRMVITCR